MQDQEHGRTQVRPRALKPGRRILVVESEVFSRLGTEEKLIAKALLTMAAVPAHELKPARRRS
jgi:acyl-coenzyme A thioesterase PaaI-like protein